MILLPPFFQCSKSCGSGSRTRTVLCLANNETADLKQCGVDTIPFAEEKCNTQTCDDATPEPTTETPLVEVCEEVEVDDEGGEEESIEGSAEPEQVEKPIEKSSAKPVEKPAAKPEEEKPEETEESSGSKEGMMEVSGAGSAEDLAVSMSAEGSGDMEPASVFVPSFIQIYF